MRGRLATIALLAATPMVSIPILPLAAATQVRVLAEVERNPRVEPGARSTTSQVPMAVLAQVRRVVRVVPTPLPMAPVVAEAVVAISEVAADPLTPGRLPVAWVAARVPHTRPVQSPRAVSLFRLHIQVRTVVPGLLWSLTPTLECPRSLSSRRRPQPWAKLLFNSRQSPFRKAVHLRPAWS